MSNKNNIGTRPQQVVCPCCGSTNMKSRENSLLHLDGIALSALIVYPCIFSGGATFLISRLYNSLYSGTPLGIGALIAIFLFSLLLTVPITHTIIETQIKERYIRDGITVDYVVCNGCHMKMRIVRPRVISDCEPFSTDTSSDVKELHS